jgi:hypothetical protein
VWILIVGSVHENGMCVFNVVLEFVAWVQVLTRGKMRRDRDIKQQIYKVPLELLYIVIQDYKTILPGRL